MTRILIRRGTYTQWTSSTTPLSSGEFGLDTTNNIVKIGNGTDLWIDLTGFVLSSDLSNSLGDYVPIGDVGNPDGVASLDSTGNVPISQLGNIISGAPAVLDTLNELAAALNNDQNFTNTVNTALSGKVSKSGGSTIIPSSGSVAGLSFTPATGQTANLLEFVGGPAGGGVKVGPGGNIFDAPAINANYSFTATAGASGVVPVTIKGVSGQSANLTEWKTSANNVGVYVDGNGQFGTNYFFTNFGGGNYKNNGLITINPANNIVPLVITGASGQTSDLQEWKNYAGTTLAAVSSGGSLYGTGVYASYLMQVTSGASSQVALTVKGAVSQSANLQEWQNSSGTNLLRLNSAGKLLFGSGGSGVGFGTSIIFDQVSGTNSPDGITWNFTTTNTASAQVLAVRTDGSYATDLYFTTANPADQIASEKMRISSTGTVTINGFTSSSKGLIVKAAASQTANLQEWQNSSGTVLSKVDKDGVFTSTYGANLSTANVSATAGVSLFIGGQSGAVANTVLKRSEEHTSELQSH